MHVCKTLSEPDLNGLQTCLEWESQSGAFGLPDLSPQEAWELGYAILYVCAVTFTYKLIAKLIEKFI